MGYPSSLQHLTLIWHQGLEQLSRRALRVLKILNSEVKMHMRDGGQFFQRDVLLIHFCAAIGPLSAAEFSFLHMGVFLSLLPPQINNKEKTLLEKIDSCTLLQKSCVRYKLLLKNWLALMLLLVYNSNINHELKMTNLQCQKFHYGGHKMWILGHVTTADNYWWIFCRQLPVPGKGCPWSKQEFGHVNYCWTQDVQTASLFTRYCSSWFIMVTPHLWCLCLQGKLHSSSSSSSLV